MGFWSIVGSVVKWGFEQLQENVNEYRAAQSEMGNKSTDDLTHIVKNDNSRFSRQERLAAFKELKERDELDDLNS